MFLLTFFCQENVMPALVSGLDVPPLMDLILFYILDPMNIATINTWMWVFIFEIILKKQCVVEWMDYMVVVFLVSWEICMIISW